MKKYCEECDGECEEVIVIGKSCFCSSRCANKYRQFLNSKDMTGETDVKKD